MTSALAAARTAAGLALPRLDKPLVMPFHVGAPTPETARQGRDKQRYGSRGERLVAGCIPTRVVLQPNGRQAVEVLLISSRNGDGSCLFPKGGWETDETVEAAAARETVEEAGVRGELESPTLGCFTFRSSKAAGGAADCGMCIAHVFAMRVAEELDSWPEADRRMRTWVPLAEAAQLCRHEWMRRALGVYAQRVGLAKGA